MAEIAPDSTALPPAPERARIIAGLLGGPVRGLFVPFRGAHAELPVIRVPAEILVYRLDNGRIFFELERAFRQLGTTRSGVLTEQDAPGVQLLLHRLLVEKAKNPQGPVFQELARHRQQTEPLLISADGVVVNGNRRLAAMRELMTVNPLAYSGFGQVAAAVLPAEASSAEIELVEAALQMAPEIKLAYSWVNRRLKLRTQRDALRLSPAEIREAYRLKDDAQLGREIGELSLAEDYLEHFDEAGRYDLVEDAEAYFTGLLAELHNLDELLRGLWRLAGFTIIRARDGLEAAVAKAFPFAPATPPDLPAASLRNFAVEIGILNEADAGTAMISGALAEDLRLVLTRRDGGEDRAASLLAGIDAVRSQHRDRNAPQRLLRRLRDVRRLIEGLEPGSLSRDQKRRLRSDIAALREQTDYVLGEPDARPATPVKPVRAGLARRVSRQLRRWLGTKHSQDKGA